MPSARTKPTVAAALPPVFHPDHPHNNPSFASSTTTSTPLGPAYDLNTPCPPVRTRRHPSASTGMKGKSPGGGMSDSDASASASPCRKRCFCGRDVVDGGIYCSIDCARSDAFTSLCYKPGGPSSSTSTIGLSRQPSVESTGSSATLSRQASSSAASTVSAISEAEPSDWNASHYRRVARSDARRDERREERRRRRAEGSVASSTISRSTTYSTISTASSSSSRVPDLVSGHSRNASTVSTASSSGWSGSGLSRNPSSASTMSSASRRYRGDTVAVIQEDDDEEEFLDTRPYPLPGRNGSMGGGLGHKKTRSGHARKRIAEPIGMGKDMRDILEEIISMEKCFNVDDDGLVGGYDDHENHGMQAAHQPGLFTASFDKPPRTPSPVAPGRKRSVVPSAPLRGHRSNLSNPLASPRTGAIKPQRPPSLMNMHQSSLSESHTALYLATASPVAPSRRSASPQLRSRNSITFTPESAGPIIGGVNGSGGKSDSPVPNAFQLSTPSRRRPQISPNAPYAAMDGWRFPGSNAGSTTPRSTQHTAPLAALQKQPERMPAHLLWPAPPLFPQSPGVDTPTFVSALQGRSASTDPSAPAVPPTSGMRLGYLLGSGAATTSTSHEGDIEMDLDDEDGSMEQGQRDGDGDGSFGRHSAYGGIAGQFLPVFLEAEGFRQTRLWSQA